MAEQYVKGLPQLSEFLRTLPSKIQNNILRGASRSGMNQIKPVAQAGVHNVSGLLSRGLKVGTKVRRGVVIANLKATGQHASIAHLVEYGTAAHAITVRLKKALSFGQVRTQKVQHPGTQPRPFMRPALDRASGSALTAMALYIRARLTKEGINAAHVMVEGDE